MIKKLVSDTELAVTFLQGTIEKKQNNWLWRWKCWKSSKPHL